MRNSILRAYALGVITGSMVTVGLTMLAAPARADVGDGTIAGTIGSSAALALLVVYLLLCVLFQDFLRPLVIMFSVPLASTGIASTVAPLSAAIICQGTILE